MAISEKSSGAQAATVGTEHTLLSTVDLGTYQLQVDVSVLVGGDELELRIKHKVRSAGTQREVYLWALGPVPPNTKIWIGPPVACTTGADFTLKQTVGTSRTFDWAVVRLDA